MSDARRVPGKSTFYRDETETHVHVQVTLSVSLGAPWGGVNTLDELYRIGAREGLEAFERLIRERPEFSVVTAPHVLLVTTEKRR
jgi:hypothetical protein